MKWMLVQRKPDVIYAGRPDLFLGTDGSETEDTKQAATFDTREAAESFRRKLRHPYDWAAMSVPK